MIDKKYILLLLIAFSAALFISWPSSYVVPVSEETVKEIVYGDSFRNWSFRDQIELAEALRKLATDEELKLNSLPENVREYLLKLAGTVKALRSENRTDIHIMTVGEMIYSEKFADWRSEERNAFPKIVDETRQKKRTDITMMSQRMVVAYIILLKDRALEAAVAKTTKKSNNSLGIYIKL